MDGRSKLAKLQADNPKRYCDLEEYYEGYVCFMDILGFGDYSLDENKFIIIRDLINSFINSQINEEVNDDLVKISIASDSIIMTVKEPCGYIDLDFIISRVMYFRRLVVKNVGTDIRAGITYGKYVHEGYKGQLYFGPAITRSVRISEKVKTVSCKYGTCDAPAGVYLDKVLFDERDNTRLFVDEYEKYLVKLNNENYLVNPYMFEFYNKGEYFTKMLAGESTEDVKEYDYWIDYYKKQLKKLKAHDEERIEYKQKYSLYKGMLNDFLTFIEKIDRNKKI